MSKREKTLSEWPLDWIERQSNRKEKSQHSIAQNSKAQRIPSYNNDHCWDSRLAIPAGESEFKNGGRKVRLIRLDFPGIESGSPPDRLLAAEAHSLRLGVKQDRGIKRRKEQEQFGQLRCEEMRILVVQTHKPTNEWERGRHALLSIFQISNFLNTHQPPHKTSFRFEGTFVGKN